MGEPFQFGGKSLADWQTNGKDAGAVIGDPGFVDPLKRDFRFKPGAAAVQHGFKPFDYSKAGVYGDTAWISRAKNFMYPPVTFAPDPSTIK